jgi:NTE family protein
LIASGGKRATETLGGPGVKAFEALLETMIREDVAVLDWHARGGEPVALSIKDARELLREMRTTKFVAAGSRRGRVGLVLLAGGPRGAYEAGALSVLLPALEARGERPVIFVGAGSGAINAAFLASRASEPAQVAAGALISFWNELVSADVYGSLLSPKEIARRTWTSAAQLAGLPGQRPTALMDLSPLAKTLARFISFDQIQHNVANGSVAALGVVTLSVRSGRSVVFTTAAREPPPPNQGHAIDYIATDKISLTHLMASFALPGLFPAVDVGEPPVAAGWYVHGGVRLNAPLAPLLDLGADRIVAIGTEPLFEADSEPEVTRRQDPDFVDMLALLLQSTIADRLAEDIYATSELNALLASGGAGHGKSSAARRTPFLLVTPADRDEIGRLASFTLRRHGGLRAYGRNPTNAVLVQMFGVDGPKRGQLMSNILFDPEIIGNLIALGERDAVAALGEGKDALWKLRLGRTRRPPRGHAGD